VQTGLRPFAMPAQSFLDAYRKLLRSKWNLCRRHKIHYAQLVVISISSQGSLRGAETVTLRSA
jgi:hypothetical protein